MTSKADKSFRYSPEVRQCCRAMFIRGATVDDIALNFNIPPRTVYSWRKSEKWDAFCPEGTVEEVLARRISVLTAIEDKTKNQQEEWQRAVKAFGALKIDLAKAEETKARALWIKNNGIPTATAQAATEGDNQEAPRPKGKRKEKEKKVKNDISEITPEMLAEVRAKLFTCQYTAAWHAAKENPLTRRIRFILKSRQIGATFYFAWEALEDAILTGDNQIFLSASRSQAEVFKGYMIAFAKIYLELDLKGTDVITLSNGANLRFLSTNATTAQSYTGHLYIDEVFWIPKFEKVNHVAGAIATHKHWRKTYFSTPSAKSHQAYPMWSGEIYNNKLPEKKRAAFDVTWQNLKDGQMFPDGIWRHIVTAQDAVDQGFDRIDIDMLKLESSSQDAFDNLYMCKFIDDSQSVFNLQTLLDCVLEAMEWKDYNPNAARPYANNPVAIGYDTGVSLKGDAAQRALLGIPIKPKDPFRLLGLRKLQGQNFEFQANRIKEDVENYNVQYIALDLNGLGIGVHEHVQRFYPAVTPLNYSPDNKNRLVMKMLDLINTKRFLMLQRDQDVISSFMLIKKTISNGSGAIIYKTERNAAGGHGDSAWAIINGVSYEPLVGSHKHGTVVIQA
ncbi:terminase large subunit domain-containing protein [Methylovulum psychrotolerans]|uniref:Terminase n=1 Tax=Methylovulum psychrotolerans TaxID=1704499 RepID=A0A2S5CGF6_9GAMM|nr:terminase family protein [Methylovulum psychrotolerans]POZ49891.1 hypothetical protein AADEFJLK_04337 [Methylovulum psychrotolerans]